MIDYSWVPWFRELARKIAQGGESVLVEKAAKVNWYHKSEDPPILRYGNNIDPFSFIYSLTPRSNSFMQRLQSAGAIYAVTAPLSTALPIIPSANPINALFHAGGQGSRDVLWYLFRQAVKDDPSIDGKVFNDALRIGNVAIRKLSQTLFIINANHFLPTDRVNKVLPQLEFRREPKSHEEYADRVEAMKALFPGCKPYEINTFLYMQSTQQSLITNETKYFHVSTAVDGDDSRDYWSEFESQNAVWTGASGPPSGQPYPSSNVRPGDVVLVRYGIKDGRGIGVVEDNGYSDGWSEEGRISVCWVNKRSALIDGQTQRRALGFAPQGSRSYQSFKSVDGYSETLQLIDEMAHDEATAASKTVHSKQDDAPEDADVPLNRIFYGPPGTGKTFDAVTEAVKTIDGGVHRERNTRFKELKEEQRIEFVTFHQNYAYEDFIEGIRPVLDQEELRYELREGIFKRIAGRASKDPSNRYVLIIDEINRGNIAKIFGELITLIEPSKRVGGDDPVEETLQYSQEPFSVPGNLYLIGTMNTADRGIALLDVALRRRFEFIPRMPEANHGRIAEDAQGVDCRKLLRAINDRIFENLDRDHQIGHTYLLGVQNLEGLQRVFQAQIIPLLQEYFYDDWEKMRRVLNNNPFIIKTDKGAERSVFDVLPPDDDHWRQAESYKEIYDDNSGSGTDEGQ